MSLSTLRIGSVDASGVPANRQKYIFPFHEWTSNPTQFRGESNSTWFKLAAKEGSNVTVLQFYLQAMGFYPKGPMDGIYGYRTLSAVRLFQEYARTIDCDPAIGKADGIAGPKTRARIDQWVGSGKEANWTPVDKIQKTIFTCLKLLRHHFLALPDDPATDVVNRYTLPSSTRQVADWKFDPNDMHLIGIRRDDTSLILRDGKYVRRNDDIFILLVNGSRFFFRGSTYASPSMAGCDDAAYLIRGQHEYRFGWHKINTVGSDVVKVYRAFKPKSSNGVLVVRAENGQLTPSSYAKGAEANSSINIQWGGAETSNWSAGCQVIAGIRYKNMRNRIVDLSRSASPSYATLNLKTRGAYNVLIDLATVFSDDFRCNSSDTLYYTLLSEKDLKHAPGSAGLDFRQLIAEFSWSI
jgi:hypothetical protein